MGDEPIDEDTRNKSIADELAKLAELAERGVLTREEFEHQKSALLQVSPHAGCLADAERGSVDCVQRVEPAQFTNADRLRALANLPPAKMIWSGVFFLVLGSFGGSAFFAFLGTGLFFIGIVLTQAKPTP